MSDVIATLPSTGDASQWSEQEKALVKAAGLVRTEGRGQMQQEYLADRATVEAFLAHCRRTQLDPIARQIYAIYRAGKWGIQLSIDGARLVAERSGAYEGQEDVEYSNDGGRTWSVAWSPTEEQPYPTHARVGVFKRGHRQALRAVARWDSYVVTKDEWSGGSKTGRKVVADMWSKMPDTMLAKVAEMLALRKAFPQDLSGLYSSEEMQQAGGTAAAPAPAEQPVVEAPSEPIVSPGVLSRDWVAIANGCVDLVALRDVWMQARDAEELGLTVADGRTVGDVVMDRKKVIEDPRPPVEPESKAVPLEAPAEPITWTAREPGSGASAEDDYSALDAIADAEGAHS